MQQSIEGLAWNYPKIGFILAWLLGLVLGLGISTALQQMSVMYGYGEWFYIWAYLPIAFTILFIRAMANNNIPRQLSHLLYVMALSSCWQPTITAVTAVIRRLLE
jgi:hypothetical protein